MVLTIDDDRRLAWLTWGDGGPGSGWRAFVWPISVEVVDVDAMIERGALQWIGPGEGYVWLI